MRALAAPDPDHRPPPPRARGRPGRPLARQLPRPWRAGRTAPAPAPAPAPHHPAPPRPALRRSSGRYGDDRYEPSERRPGPRIGYRLAFSGLPDDYDWM